MTPEQRRQARHALGLGKGQKRSYRNRFFSYINNELWVDLVMQGLAYFYSEKGRAKGYGCYTLTVEGARMALDTGESLCPEDFPQESAK